MKSYLLKIQDHLYGGVTLFFANQDITRSVKEGEDYRFAPFLNESESLLRGSSEFGHLELGDSIIFLVADGQHRIKSLIEASNESQDIAQEQITVTLLPFHNMDQVRQVFADLNLNAKPVSKSVSYGFESRDPLAKEVKKFAEQHPLLINRVNYKSNSFSETSNDVISISILVEISEELHKTMVKLGLLNDQEFGSSFYDYLRDFFDSLVFSPPFQQYWQPLAKSQDGKMPVNGISPDHDHEKYLYDLEQWGTIKRASKISYPGYLRLRYIFPHGIGWRALSYFAIDLMKKYGWEGWLPKYQKAVQSIDWERTSKHWQDIGVTARKTRKAKSSDQKIPVISVSPSKPTLGAFIYHLHESIGEASS
jgi:DGQHR domain-containing protein